MSTNFSSFAFKNTGGPIGGVSPVIRTVPSRLSDIINVVDWGADPTGQADSGAAIRAALDWGYRNNSRHQFIASTVLFFPPGVFKIANPPLDIKDNAFGGGNSNLEIHGSGRDATIIRGLNNTGYIVKCDFANFNQQPRLMQNLTIENTSTTSGSGAWYEWGGIIMTRRNCRFKGFNGAFVATNETYNVVWQSCVFECSAPIGAANSTTPGPAAGSTGVICYMGPLYSCVAIGFEIGFGISQTGMPMMGCYAYRCKYGLWVAGSTGTNQPQNKGVQGASIVGNTFERCTEGVYSLSLTGGSVCGNAFIGDRNGLVPGGPCDPATIQSMSWSGGTVTVTTAQAHNLAAGTQTLALAVLPAAWLPNADGLVSATKQDATHFTYTGVGSQPPAFSSGSWNYPMFAAISSASSHSALIAANALLAPVSWRSVDVKRGSSTAFEKSNYAMAMTATYGWHLPTNGTWDILAWEFLQCASPGLNQPIAYIKTTDLIFNRSTPGTGTECTAIDLQTLSYGDVAAQTLFLSTAATSGSNIFSFTSIPSWIVVGTHMDDINTGDYASTPFRVNGWQVSSIDRASTPQRVFANNNLGGTIPSGSPILFSARTGTNHYKVRHVGNATWIRVG